MVEQTVTLPVAEANQIRELHRLLQLGSPALIGPHEERMALPESVYRILKDIVRNMNRGRAITLVPQREHMTTQSAASFLGFSRPYLIKLLESGAIPFERVGQHRRVRFKDILVFQRKRDDMRRAALNALAKAEQDEGLYEGSAIPEEGSDE